MKIYVHVKPNSRKEEVVQIEPDRFQIKVHAPPEDGKANKRVIELLAKFLGIAKTRLQIIRGHKGKQKVISVDEDI